MADQQNFYPVPAVRAWLDQQPQRGKTKAINAALLEHIRQCRARMAPKELLDALEQGEMIPLFNISEESSNESLYLGTATE